MTLILCILVFGILVVVHEFGHFIAARLSGVQVLKFSVGFGPKIIGFKKGNTEYQISLIPLGGLVKLLGEDPSETIDEGLRSKSFTHKSLFYRSFIVISGPLFNLFLPALIFSLIYFFGWPEISTKIGTVLYDSPAWMVGIRPGDRIVNIDDKPVNDWETLSRRIKKSANKKITLKIQRGDELFKSEIVPLPERDFNEFGEETQVGKIGIGPLFKKNIIAVDGKNTAGLKHLDEILSVDGKSIKWFGEFEEEIRKKETTLKKIELKRSGQNINLTISRADILDCLGDNGITDCGIYPAELSIKNIKENSPAFYSKIKRNDILYSLNGAKLYDFNTLEKFILIDSPGIPFNLGLIRDGKLIEKKITPTKEMEKDELLGSSKEMWHVGIEPYFEPSDIEHIVDKSQYNPFLSVIKGTGRTIELTYLSLVGFGKLIGGRISIKNLGGPIMIYQLTGKSYKYGGLLHLIKILAILSLSLAIINLVPIPVLDGGHLFFFAIEAVRGSPVSLRTREIAQQVGFTILIMLTILTFYNDIMRILGR